MRLYLKRRKGFIKLALRFGVNLVPTLSFNEQFIYNQISAEEGIISMVHLKGYIVIAFYMYVFVNGK